MAALATDKLNHPIEVKYENNTYKYVILTIDGITPVSTAELIYIPESNQFSINFTENGRNVQSDGKFIIIQKDGKYSTLKMNLMKI